ncbi:muconolactone Delta-isomerase [Vreelandella populi]|uniref:Muconolactone Delta-isomerase n=1 Tax=Vreelandella populi TaxID=2498858 RepID=A0A433LAX4_9GAMM|nr:muconolactone Delta-isomerase [Halomonas populi]RUR45133.1 muconolactone Delta-isomerase [Halomonas populi]
MLFQVEMTVKLPTDMPTEQADKIKATEKSYSQDLQRQGKWRHLWRVAGSYSNVSIFDAEDNAELQELVSNLPLFPYMEINVKPLCRHPSSVREDDS